MGLSPEDLSSISSTLPETIHNDDDDEATPLIEFRQEEVRKTSLMSAIFNLSNTAIGAGTVAIPSAFSSLGLYLGLICTVIAALTTGVSLYFLACLQEHAGTSVMQGIGKKAFGKRGELTVVIFLLILLYAPLIAYQIIVDAFQISSSLVNSWFLDYRFVTFSIVTLLIFPLCQMKDMAVLAKMSFVCICCIFYTVMLIVFDLMLDRNPQSPIEKEEDLPRIDYFKISFEGIGAFATILMSFISHTSILDVIKSLKNPTPSRKIIAIGFTNVINTICYVLIGAAGYIHYGSSVKDNILTQKSDPAFIVGCISFGLMIALTYPLILVPAVYCLEWIFDQIKQMLKPSAPVMMTEGKSDGRVDDDDNNDDSRSSDAIACGNNSKSGRFWKSLFIVYSAFALNILWRNIKTVFGLFGCLCGSMIIFIFPSVFYLKCLYPEISLPMKIAAIVNIIMGSFLLIFGTYSQLYDFIVAFP